MLNLTTEDLRRLEASGIGASSARQQLRILRDPPTPPRVVRPCTLNDGIRELSPQEHQPLQELWRKAATGGRVSKFVPASGAATRMFADLTDDNSGEPSEAAVTFWQRRSEFAFANELETMIPPDRGEDPLAVAEALVSGLGYGDLPKALIPFHSGPEGARTAFLEHLVEAAGYTTNAARTPIRVHFTIGSEHQSLFEKAREGLQGLELTLGSTLEVDFSVQDPATDTLSVSSTKAPFRDARGDLLLRPAGHGALLSNLERLGGDIVIIKNIDNILPQDRQPEAVYWKRLLIGLSVHLECQLREISAKLEGGKLGPLEGAEAVAGVLGIEAPEADREDWLLRRLDSPLRVCGMVRNDDEPGGGPFWVAGANGVATPQIVETAQLDRRDPAQEAAWRDATHFNPVDLVCSLRTPQGTPYDLAGLVDPTTAFVSEKKHDDRALRVLERPGLWNGSMAGWNTVFVEVPASTFSPVKTVLDLLRPEHLPLPAG